MKKLLFLIPLVLVASICLAQMHADSIREDDVRKTMAFLSSDKLGGRVNHTTGQLEATRFLYSELERMGLKPFNGYNSFLQKFHAGEFAPISGNDFSWRSALSDSTIILNTQYLYNLVAVLPGKGRPGEAVIFSAHYDHIDYNITGDPGLYNGANDNASGTTAVLALAKYYAMRNDNERTIIFCLFAGEELGLLGSRDFVEQIQPDSIVAVINVEMIGLTNATGKNGFFVTGADHSRVYDILKKNLTNAGSKFRVIPLNNDPTRLYERSDNYPFALKGIPAHSIMCSDDGEACYHRPCDDFKFIKIDNMTNVIRAIAIGASTIVSGGDTPVRIK